MFSRARCVLAYHVLRQLFLCSVFLSEFAHGQQAVSNSRTNPAQAGSAQPSRTGPLVDLDITLRGPDDTILEEPAALTLVGSTGQIYKQGTTKNAHVRWTELTPAQYGIHIVAPGFERAFRQIDAHTSGEVEVTVELRRQTGSDQAYPPVSEDSEVNYVFGLYASRWNDLTQAKLYWMSCLQLQRDYVPALLSMGEALLSENQTSDAKGYLDRAEKIAPSYWRTHALLAEVFVRTGSPAEAVQHAQRALELGHQEAAGVSPLLSRALVAQATEVLRAYLTEHPDDVDAKKQFEHLNAPAEFRSSESLSADVRDRTGLSPTTPPASVKSAVAQPPSPSRGSRWMPADVDADVPSVEVGAGCNLQEVLQKTGLRVQEFVENVQRFTATQSLLHEAIKKSGKVSEKQQRKYDYTVSIEEIRPGFLGVEEYQSSGSNLQDTLGGLTSKGLPALILIFHPYYSGTFSMRCEGLSTLNGKRTWQIYFRQRDDKPNSIRAYRVGLNKPPHPVALKGRAWFVEDSYQIVGMQTDLVNALPDIQLAAEHTIVEYGPVHFSSRGVDLWLPQTAELYSELKGKRVHQRMTFSNYLLFSVDDRQKISSPKTIPEPPQSR
jgi:tetratricopeptide (TPR) repeat protein